MIGKAARSKNKRYSSEFKRQAVQKLSSGDYTLKKLADELGVSVMSLVKWRADERRMEEQTKASDLKSCEAEIAELRAEVERLRQECERLKRGMAYMLGIER